MTSSPSSGGLAESAARLLESAEQHFTPCGNGRLQWQQWSDAGPPLLLLHGGFGSWNHWYANIDRLRQERALWTLDMPGLGASGDIFRQARPQHFAAIIAPGLRRFMGRRALDIAAFSFGAMVGVHLVHAVRCSRFFAIGAAGCGALHVQVPLEAPPRDDSAAFDVHRRNLRALMFSAGFPIDAQAVRFQADNLARARFNSRPLSLTGGFVDSLPRLDAPLVGVWGSEDATAGGEAGIRQRREIFQAAQPGCDFHVLENTGHWAMYETPDVVSDILLQG